MITTDAVLPSTRYEDGIIQHRWQRDNSQLPVIEAFDHLHTALLEMPKAAPQQSNLFGRLRHFLNKPESSTDAPQGIYLWGSVGRGKTFLMDLFVSNMPEGMVARRHFHQFMQDVHAQLRTLKDHEDPLKIIGENLAKRARVLCLDEFLVDDIGDAMILYGLLKSMTANRMALVTTSNTPPSELYKDGLQRARFMPAIELIENHCKVIELVSKHDWRLRTLEQASIYQTPPSVDATRQLQRIFKDFARGEIHTGTTLDIHKRPIKVERMANNIIWFSFDALCEGPRSRADYVTLAQDYAAIVVSNIPIFTPENHNQAKRFIHLVDALYDESVKLVVSAAAPIVDLYEGERLRAEFARTESRLIEMQSEDYLKRHHQQGQEAATA